MSHQLRRIQSTFFGKIRKNTVVSMTSTAVVRYRRMCPINSQGSSNSVKKITGTERTAAIRSGQGSLFSHRYWISSILLSLTFSKPAAAMSLTSSVDRLSALRVRERFAPPARSLGESVAVTFAMIPLR